jgi:hypothetical protein
MSSLRADVKILPERREAAPSTGSVRSVEEAEVRMPEAELDELWRPEYLERLAFAYWIYLRRASFGLLRVVYEPGARSVALVSRRLTLLRFRRPEYAIATGVGQVTWRIERGILVASEGRGRGFLRITVRRVEPEHGSPAFVRVRSEVANYYPFLRLRGGLARAGARLYSATQLRIHVWITHGFLRSLAALDLPPSQVGALRAGAVGGSPQDERP